MASFFGFLRQKISENDLVDLHGKVVLITGGNSGIGFTTIQFLARRGAKVYMACRREEAYEDALKRLNQAGLGDGSVHWLHLDLSDPRLANKAAKEMLRKERRLDILINNAAKGNGPYAMTKDGMRESMVVNYLSHFVFTETLLPLLIRTSKEEGSDVRIVNVSSSVHPNVTPHTLKGKESWNIDFGDTTLGRINFYGLSKLANILHAKNLQGRLDAQKVNITCIAVDPGKIVTENTRRWFDSIESRLNGVLARIYVSLLFVSPREGAMNSAYAAASPEVKAQGRAFKSVYLTPVGRVTDPSPHARDERLAQELYDTSMEIVKEMKLEL